MYFEFLFRRAHSRRRVERRYWSGESLYSRTTCSNSVTVGVIGPIGSGLPQLGFPRRFAMKIRSSVRELKCFQPAIPTYKDSCGAARDASDIGSRQKQQDTTASPDKSLETSDSTGFFHKVNRK